MARAVFPTKVAALNSNRGDEISKYCTCGEPESEMVGPNLQTRQDCCVPRAMASITVRMLPRWVGPDQLKMIPIILSALNPKTIFVCPPVRNS